MSEKATTRDEIYTVMRDLLVDYYSPISKHAIYVPLPLFPPPPPSEFAWVPPFKEPWYEAEPEPEPPRDEVTWTPPSEIVVGALYTLGPCSAAALADALPLYAFAIGGTLEELVADGRVARRTVQLGGGSPVVLFSLPGQAGG